jgi:hypothetical protein
MFYLIRNQLLFETENFNQIAKARHKKNCSIKVEYYLEKAEGIPGVIQ